RLGVVTQKGLSANLRQQIKSPLGRYAALTLIWIAIVIGNAAYEGGNIGGAVLGLEALFGTSGLSFYPFLVGILVFMLLYLGNYRVLEKVFVFLVVIMSLSFFITALLTRPNVMELLKGMFTPSLPGKGVLTAISLVGTTLVPYNLFLHASLVNEKWKTKDALNLARRDTLIAIGLGGLVSMAIVVSASGIDGGTVTGVMDLAKGLEPLYGPMAHYCMGIGLFAAGVTSALTAPLAAAYVTMNCFGWKGGFSDLRFRAVWIGILVLGTLFMSLEIKPLVVIKFAQVANGLLLPFIAFFLLWVVNRKSLMGNQANSPWQNLLGLVIILLVVFLGIRSVLPIFGFWDAQ
ncbi:MAG: divalent metal cation transporter, partial [Bacteroidota bacterium]